MLVYISTLAKAELSLAQLQLVYVISVKHYHSRHSTSTQLGWDIKTTQSCILKITKRELPHDVENWSAREGLTEQLDKRALEEMSIMHM